MVEVGHDRQVPPRARDAPEEIEHVVGVVVGDETVGPVAQRFRADTDGREAVEVRLEEGLNVGTEAARFHHHRIAPGDEDVRDASMLAQIVHEAFGLLCREFEIVDADELRPAEAEGAIGVAGLAVAGEEQHRLFVLVLHALEALLVQHGHVVLELAGGVGVEGQTNPVRGLVDSLAGGAALDERGHLLEVRGLEHVPLRESQREYRIVGTSSQLISSFTT